MTASGQRWFVPKGRSHNLPLPRLLLLKKHLLSWSPPPFAFRDPPPSAQSLSRPQINLLQSLGNTWPTNAVHVSRNQRRPQRCAQQPHPPAGGTRAKLRKRALPSCAGGIIWSLHLRSDHLPPLIYRYQLNQLAAIMEQQKK